MVKKIVWWVLTLLCLSTIFGFSGQSAADSSQVSSSLTASLLSLIPSFNELSHLEQAAVVSVGHGIIRDLAHIATFAALGFCVYMLVRSYKLHRSFLTAFPSCVVVAVADECLQHILAAGRAFQWSDLLKDWFGALLGTGVAIVVCLVIKGIRKES